MTLIDAVLMLVCVLAFARWPMRTPLALVAVVGAAAATFALEGWRVPLVPAYTAAVGLLIAALLPVGRLPQFLQRLAVGGGLLLLAASVAACIVLPLQVLWRFPPI